MKNVTIRQALKQVVDFPNMVDDDLLTKPTHELLARTLFDIANRPDASVRGSMARANKARDMIMNRLEGKRRAGTKPQTHTANEIQFIDLTGGELDGPAQQPDGAEA